MLLLDPNSNTKPRDPVPETKDIVGVDAKSLEKKQPSNGQVNEPIFCRGVWGSCKMVLWFKTSHVVRLRGRIRIMTFDGQFETSRHLWHRANYDNILNQSCNLKVLVPRIFLDFPLAFLFGALDWARSSWIFTSKRRRKNAICLMRLIESNENDSPK